MTASGREGAATLGVERDDRILPATRRASLVIFVSLIPALVVLWGFPGETDELWAWTIEPRMTPIFMGAALGGAGAYFFGRVSLARLWHPAAIGILAVAIFGTLMLVVTLIHWERFNHGDAPTAAAMAFYLWVALYVAAPPLMATLWLRNRRTDPRRPDPSDATMPPAALNVARGLGGIGVLAAALFLFWPQAAIDIWPWELTPLTARVLGCFAAQVSVGALALSLDERWSSWRLLIETFLVATALLLIGTVRAWDDLDLSNPLAWTYLGALAASVITLPILIRDMNSRRGAPSAPAE